MLSVKLSKDGITRIPAKKLFAYSPPDEISFYTLDVDAQQIPRRGDNQMTWKLHNINTDLMLILFEYA